MELFMNEDFVTKIDVKLILNVINNEINQYSKDIQQNSFATSSLIARSQLRGLKKKIALKYKKYLNKHTVLLPTNIIFNQDGNSGSNR